MLAGLPDHGLATCPIDRSKLEVLPAIAEGHGNEQSEPDDVGPEPRQRRWLSTRAAVLAIDANDLQEELAERTADLPHPR